MRVLSESTERDLSTELQVHLKKLDLGKNKIQKIEGLETLTSLVQLSLEDNEIESMAGLRYAKRASYHP